MPRRTRASRLETRTSRLKLEVRFKPHDFTPIAPEGVGLGYRRNRGAGSWVLRIADGKGGYATTTIGVADDLQSADGDQILTWFQAIERGRQFAKSDVAPAERPTTVADAIREYANDLAARRAGPENATRITKNLTPTLAAKPVGLLTARDLSMWRDALLRNGVKAATMVRLGRAVKAALNLAARRDHRIANRNAWGDGLGGVAENYDSRNIQRLDDNQVRAVVAAAYARDHNLGLYVEVAAETGARPSQLSRLLVGDLQDGDAPRLMMPSSRKGRGRKASRYPVPITKQLADKLASDQAPDAPLMVRKDGRCWQETDHGDYANLFEQVVDRLGLDVTFYALRHSAIIRALLAGVPIRVVAANADTSAQMIEQTYSAHVSHFADEAARRGLVSFG
jgi:integrase